MRFVLSVALRYLIPRWRQLSVSIISLVSVLVISLVVWLVIVFLSVTEGIESGWVKQLVALNAPLRMTPTEAYFQSYYHQIDSLSLESNYSSKTLGEKLISTKTNPYDPEYDAELPSHFPTPLVNDQGELVDIVKETLSTIQALEGGKLRAQEFEIGLGNLRLSLIRDHASQELSRHFLSQVSYIATHDPYNDHLKKLILTPSTEDYTNLFNSLELSNEDALGDEKRVYKKQATGLKSKLVSFFNQWEITELRTLSSTYPIPPALFPEKGELMGFGIVNHGVIKKIIIPDHKVSKDMVQQGLTTPLELVEGSVEFIEKQPYFISNEEMFPIGKHLTLYANAPLQFLAKVVDSSFDEAESIQDVRFQVSTDIQGLTLKGVIPYTHLQLSKVAPLTPPVTPLLVCKEGNQCIIPYNSELGDGILISKSFKNSGVLVGDRGFVSYYSTTPSGMQEMRLPIYVAGFYDPGLMPTGSKLVFVDTQVLSALRNSMSVSDDMLGNGFNIWTPNIEHAGAIKAKLIEALKAKGLHSYWTIESFEDYEFSKPVLQQLKSDKNLFTLIAIIILIVACSNIISMLILLVNDKKKEIGVLQSMGASSFKIGSIFGLCGFLTGLTSSIIGILVAMLTLRHLQHLVNFLSFLQGQEAFHTAFYGDILPNELSMNALVFVLLATIAISLLAGIVPAIKAARIRPSEILRSE